MPIPPVFRPVSPSFTFLWSFALTIGIIVSLSTKASIDVSIPLRNSSITIFSPAVPNFLSFIISFSVFIASSLFSEIITPFPAAKPSAFITTGYPNSSISSIALSIFVYSLYLAVGKLCLVIKSFENALLPSNLAHFLLGPNTFNPCDSKTSVIPITSGTSGPTTVISISFSFANLASLSISESPIFTHSATSAIPGFPGAQYIFSTFFSLLNFQQIACSLPPPPTTNIFIFSLLAYKYLLFYSYFSAFYRYLPFTK